MIWLYKGNKYNGDFKDDKKEGKGIYIEANGEKVIYYLGL